MAGENPTCSIENHPDFNEPHEISFTSLEQIIPTLREIGSQGLYMRRRDLEQELESIRFQQLSEGGIAENGVYHDVNSGLRGIAIQAELCGLNAQIHQLEQNTAGLLRRGKELARNNEQEFELYKKYVLGTLQGRMGLIDLRIIFAGNADISLNDSFVDSMVNIYIPKLDFFGITENELREYIANINGLDELYERISEFQFHELP